MSSRVANRYSKPLFELAVSQKSDERVYEEMNRLISIIQQNPDLSNLLRNPIISTEDKQRALNKIFSNFSELSRKFINLVAGKKREAELLDIAESYVSRYDEVHGLAKATVRSAIPLTEDAINKVRKYLQDAIHVDQIELENIIDPSLIGGLVIRYEDRLLDLSVSKELKEIRKQLIYN